MDEAAAAALELAHKRSRQALGAARKASQLLQAAAAGYDCFGQAEVTGEEDLDGVRELAALALAERGRIDVVFLARAPHNPKAP